jgi:hypothetical protein
LAFLGAFHGLVFGLRREIKFVMLLHDALSVQKINVTMCLIKPHAGGIVSRISKLGNRWDPVVFLARRQAVPTRRVWNSFLSVIKQVDVKTI